MKKKAQHEIVGFVLIIIIVAVVGVIFLSLSIGRGETPKRTSVEISHFLEASMYSTTDCEVNYPANYENLQGLIKNCYEQGDGDLETCLDERIFCEALDSDLEKLMSVSNLGEAYNLTIYFEGDFRDNFVEMSDGVFANCTSIQGASHMIPFSYGDGNIWVELEVCEK